jgi:hypothetical protein
MLERAGYLVRAVNSPAEFRAVILEEAVDLVLLCQTLTDEENREAVRLVSTHRPSACCMVMYSNIMEEVPCSEAVVLDVGRGPGHWMQAITHILPQATPRPSAPVPPHG